MRLPSGDQAGVSSDAVRIDQSGSSGWERRLQEPSRHSSASWDDEDHVGPVGNLADERDSLAVRRPRGSQALLARAADAGDSVLPLARDRDDAEAVGSLERDFLAVGRPLGRLPVCGGDAADSLSVRAHDEDPAPVAVARERDLLSVRRPVRSRVGGREVDLDPAPVVGIGSARGERKHRGGDGSHRGDSAHDGRRRRNGRTC